ncbi:MAG TPA: GNAT family N-acetyltransferase [Lachnospiraceae bacterium]|nr:GNAT family N-acetyltransferase [Lachnospiraceae bacterium]
MEDLRIVPADNAELLYNIAALADDIWHEHFTPIIGEQQVEYMLEKFQSVDALNRQIMSEGYEYFVLIYEYLMAGYVGIKEEEDALFLSKLYIHEECRGKHISTNVLRYLISLCKTRGLKKIWLTCNKYNANTLEVYKHLGFEIVRSQVTDIGNGFVMDDYILEYPITD